MDQLVLVHAQNINQSRGQDPFVQPLYLTRPESRISGIEERDSLSLLLGYREDLLCEIRSLQILVPVENTDKVRFGYDLLVLLCQLLGAELGQRPRVADHDVDTLARISENVVEVEIRHYYDFEAGLRMGESLFQPCDRVYGFFSSRHASKLQSIGLTIRS